MGPSPRDASPRKAPAAFASNPCPGASAATAFASSPVGLGFMNCGLGAGAIRTRGSGLPDC